VRRPRVLLTTTNRWPLPARLAIRLAKLGCDVFGLCPLPGHPLLKTRSVMRVFSYNGLHPLPSLLKAINEAAPEFIIPCDDRAVAHLHGLYRRLPFSREHSEEKLAALIEHSLGAHENYHSIVSCRHELIKAAAQQGVRAPATRQVDSVDDLRAWRAEQPLPWVLKADGTWGGGGVRFVYSMEEAEQSLRELMRPPSSASVVSAMVLNRDRSWRLGTLRDRERKISVQEFVRGRPANCAVVCYRGQVLAGIGVEVISSQDEKGPATVVRVLDSSEMKFAAERIAARLRWSGFFGLDFMIEEGTRDYYLIEMNPRCTPLCQLELGDGRDMVQALCEKILCLPCAPTASVTSKDVLAYFPQAVKCRSEFLGLSFLDVPYEEPELVDALLHPSSQRTLLGKLVDLTRGWRDTEDCAKEYVFEDAAALLRSTSPNELGVPIIG